MAQCIYPRCTYQQLSLQIYTNNVLQSTAVPLYIFRIKLVFFVNLHDFWPFCFGKGPATFIKSIVCVFCHNLMFWHAYWGRIEGVINNKLVINNRINFYKKANFKKIRLNFFQFIFFLILFWLSSDFQFLKNNPLSWNRCSEKKELKTLTFWNNKIR